MADPILLSKKLEYLAAMFFDKSYEDAVGHMCDLLEFCRQNIVDHRGRGFMTIEALVHDYAAIEALVHDYADMEKRRVMMDPRPPTTPKPAAGGGRLIECEVGGVWTRCHLLCHHGEYIWVATVETPHQPIEFLANNMRPATGVISAAPGHWAD